MPSLTDVSEALVREYLKAHKLVGTIAAFDAERPRRTTSISKKRPLREALGLQYIESNRPALELLVLEHDRGRKSATFAGDKSPLAPAGPAADGSESTPERAIRSEPPAAPGAASAAACHEKPVPIALSGTEGEASPSAVTAKQQRIVGIAAGPPPGTNPAETPLSSPAAGTATAPAPAAAPTAAAAASTAPRSAGAAPADAWAAAAPAGEVEPAAAAAALLAAARRLLFGERRGQPPSWRQGFFFNEEAGLGHGLVQRQGGPCGVVAVVQAWLVKALLEDGHDLSGRGGARGGAHSGGGGGGGGGGGDVGLDVAQAALARAMAAILWQAGAGARAAWVSAAASGPASASGRALEADCVVTWHATEGALAAAIAAAMPAVAERTGDGLVLFVYSAIVSRGAERVAADMDVEGTCLMGAHFYCTQELVNLLLVGRACSNVFVGERELDGGLRLRGVPARSRVGFLSYFEHFQVHSVGAHLKRPASPVWVVVCESHYTALWAQGLRDGDGDGGAGSAEGAAGGAPAGPLEPLELQYYDPLGGQTERILLTARPAKAGRKLDDIPLEWVIRTRWGAVDVDWNGSEKLL